MANPTSLPLTRHIFAAFLTGCLLMLACTKIEALTTTATFLPVRNSPDESMVLSRVILSRVVPKDAPPNHMARNTIVLTSGTCTLAMDTQQATSLSAWRI
jgi:hypothetical protein